MSAQADRLFTPRFFVMCGFSFSAFLSVFQILPVAPFHILDLGGTTFASGLFLGCLTYASAVSAPFTGTIGDRIGHRQALITSSIAIAGFSVGYGIMPGYRAMFALAVVHGVFWSGLLSASGAYMTSILPERRRAEGIGYWGLSAVLAIAVAPPVGFWIYNGGWIWVCVSAFILNVAMAIIAWRLPDDRRKGRVEREARDVEGQRPIGLIEWRLLGLSATLFLYSFAYGGITSFTALYADALGVRPKSLYLTVMALSIFISRPFSGRIADRYGYRRVFIPCLVLITAGLVMLAMFGSRPWMILSAMTFGLGFGAAYPTFAAYLMQQVSPARRGAAFGSMLAAFDTGIGTGSTAMGGLIGRFGYAQAFGIAAALSALALPYFLAADRRLARRRSLGSAADRTVP
jgi:MFS family permease